MFTAKDVMTLREMSGAGMMDCKKALTESDGNMDKAMDILREKSLAATAKKAGRIAAEGVVEAFVCSACGVGALVEVNCETDFVAKTDAFINFVKSIAEQVAKSNPKDVEALLEQDSVSTPGSTVSKLLNEATAKIGEKISIRRFTRYEGVVDSYIHMGGKIGVLVSANASKAAGENEEFKTVIHDVAMQIAAAKPTYVNKEDVVQDEIEKEKEILRAQAKNEPKPKPDAIIEKMVNGRIDKYYKEVCLIEQPFVKDTDQTIGQMLKAASAKIGEDIGVRCFERFEMGEGLQKREDNFADEVMGQMKKA